VLPGDQIPEGLALQTVATRIDNLPHDRIGLSQYIVNVYAQFRLLGWGQGNRIKIGNLRAMA
jgi:hypothetical protein